MASKECIAMLLAGGQGSRLMALTSKTVSYTHLDVYKRQVMISKLRRSMSPGAISLESI